MVDTQENISININQPYGSKLAVLVSLNDTILKLKEEIAAKSEVPVDRQRLVFSGKVLKDENTVGSYKIKNNLTVHLVLRNPAPSEQASLPQKSAPGTHQDTTFAGKQPISNPAKGAKRDISSRNLADHPAFFDVISGFMSDPEKVRSLAQTSPIMKSTGISPEQIEGVVSLFSDPHARGPLLEMAYSIHGGSGRPPNLGEASSFGGVSPELLSLLRKRSKDMDNGVATPSDFIESLRQNAHLFPQPQRQQQQPIAADLSPPEERFQSQLQQLNDMRFHDSQKNISALLATGGNVQAAVEYLCDSPQ